MGKPVLFHLQGEDVYVDTIRTALQLLSRMPEGCRWGLHITDEDGPGEKDAASALNITCPPGFILETLEALQERFRRRPSENGRSADWYVKLGALEVTVTE